MIALMGVIRLIRHGQASFGTADYDVLSETGVEQAGAVGVAFQSHGFGSVVTGGLRRQVDSATHAISASGKHGEPTIDDRWDEYRDLTATAAGDRPGRVDDGRDVQSRLRGLIWAWMSGHLETSESFESFGERIGGGLRDLLPLATSGRAATVFSSAGPIAMVCSRVLVGDYSLFPDFHDVMLNASITTLVVGRTGLRLLAFNESRHLSPDLVTYR
jgi:broad specificity phosphatase PhoE